MNKKYFFFLFIYLCCFISKIYANEQEVYCDDDLKSIVGQMLIVGFDGSSINENDKVAKDIIEHNIGGVILYDKNIRNKNQLQKLTRTLQELNQKGIDKYGRDNLPLVISVDYEGGSVNRLKSSKGFPSIKSAYWVARSGLKTAQISSEKMAITLNSLGINMNYAPVVDLGSNKSNPVIYKKRRAFSASPITVTKYAKIYSKSFLDNNIICVYKHFPGHGSSYRDSHKGFTDVSKSWQDEELEPYKNLFSDVNNCNVVMTAHVVNKKIDSSGLPATLSEQVLTGLLREELNFSGVIITDDIHMKAISKHYSVEETLVKTINAGANMILISNLSNSNISAEKLIRIIIKNIKQGNIAIDKIYESYGRIVTMKQKIMQSN